MCEGFQDTNQALVNSSALAQYDATKPLQLACDASPCGVGAVLSQFNSDSTERPVTFVSRALNAAEKNDAQIEQAA